MRERRGSRDDRGLVALGLAAGGVLVGHWLTYLVVQPGAINRAALLSATGHGYLIPAAEICSLSALAAAAVAFVSRLVQGGGERRTLLAVTTRLWALQSLAFLVVEIGERTAIGSAAGLVPALAVGAAAQLLVAAICAWLVDKLLEVADLVATLSIGHPPRFSPRTGCADIPVEAVVSHGASVLTAVGIRGPPSDR